jgi:hypothetical protein
MERRGLLWSLQRTERVATDARCDLAKASPGRCAGVVSWVMMSESESVLVLVMPNVVSSAKSAKYTFDECTFFHVTRWSRCSAAFAVGSRQAAGLTWGLVCLWHTHSLSHGHAHPHREMGRMHHEEIESRSSEACSPASHNTCQLIRVEIGTSSQSLRWNQR